LHSRLPCQLYHAAKIPLFSYLTWEDNGFFRGHGTAVFGTNDMQGIYGAVVFKGKSLAGIFYNSNSQRAPYLCPDTYDVNRYFQGMPSRHRILATKFLKDFDFFVREDGRKIPSVTTAFWNRGEFLTAEDPWDVVLAEGAKVMHIELMEDRDAALAAWQEECEMSPEQVEFARSLFNRKMAHPKAKIELTSAEVEWLLSTSEAPNEEGLAACREKMAAIDIIVPRSDGPRKKYKRGRQ
jgi:hypothetical protein